MCLDVWPYEWQRESVDSLVLKWIHSAQSVRSRFPSPRIEPFQALTELRCGSDVFWRISRAFRSAYIFQLVWMQVQLAFVRKDDLLLFFGVQYSMYQSRQSTHHLFRLSMFFFYRNGSLTVTRRNRLARRISRFTMSQNTTSLRSKCNWMLFAVILGSFLEQITILFTVILERRRACRVAAYFRHLILFIFIIFCKVVEQILSCWVIFHPEMPLRWRSTVWRHR